MNRQNQRQHLNQLLFASSQHNDSENQEQHSFDQDIEECQQNFLNRVERDEQWRDNLNGEQQMFLNVNGPSVQFSQNFSQNSLMMMSHRQDEDSRDERQENGNKYLKILQDKKRQQIQFNEVLDKQLNAVRQQLQKSKLQVTKYQGIVRGLQIKLKAKQNNILELEGDVEALRDEIQKLKDDKAQCFKMIAKKDDYFTQHRAETIKIQDQLHQKQKQNGNLMSQIHDMNVEIDRLNNALSVYCDTDRKLLDFRGNFGQYESPQNVKKNSMSDRELQKLKKDKNSLELEVTALRDKLNDRENRFKIMEEESRKKINLKDRRIQELQQKFSEMKEDNLKVKTQNQLNSEKTNSTLNFKNKEISGLNEKLLENDKRIKSLLEQCKKKEDKLKELNQQLTEKTKLANEREKEREEMRIKQQFDHHMIAEKDQEIERLAEEKRALKMQLDNQKMERMEKLEKLEKLEKIDRGDKNQKARRERELDKQKKQFQLVKKNAETAQKEKEELTNTLKDTKRKLDDLTKKWQQLKSNNIQLQEQLKLKKQQFQQQKQAIDKFMKQQSDTKKKADTVPQLKNKIIILQSRLKQNESQYRQSTEMSQSTNLQDKLQALQHRLELKQKQIKDLRNKLMNSNSMIESELKDEDYERLMLQIQERDDCIQKLENQLDEKQKHIEEMKRELEFKDHTLDFTHKILVSNEKAKIELEQQKKMLEEMVHRSEADNSFQGSRQELVQFYQEKIKGLQGRILQLERKLREREEGERTSKDEYRFQNRQLKERIRQLNQMLLSKDRKITPETMSQEDTANFLVKTMKRVVKSGDMMRLLTRNSQFKETFSRMEKDFRK